jgi:hypothetical protein
MLVEVFFVFRVCVCVCVCVLSSCAELEFVWRLITGVVTFVEVPCVCMHA